MLSGLTSKDPVYQILKLLQEEQELNSQLIGLDERDFDCAVQHIYEAGYANNNGLNPSGHDYITGYERRLK